MAAVDGRGEWAENSAMSRSDQLVGNRLALVGSLLYFLEWVAIAFLPDVADASHFGSEPSWSSRPIATMPEPSRLRPDGSPSSFSAGSSLR
jgi:hypothetical protein